MGAVTAAVAGQEVTAAYTVDQAATRMLLGMAGGPIADWSTRLAEVGGRVGVRRLYMEAGFTDPDVAVAVAALTSGQAVLISFKPGGATWAAMGRGESDTAAMAGYRRLSAAATAGRTRCYVCLSHEPVATPYLTGDAGTAGDFAGMWVHHAPLIRSLPGLLATPVMNGYPFSANAIGWTDAELDPWLPAPVRAAVDVIGADIYQTDRELITTRAARMIAWADRNQFPGGLLLGEFGALTTSDLATAVGYLTSSGRFTAAAIYNSSRNNREGRSWFLTGDMLATFRALVTASLT